MQDFALFYRLAGIDLVLGQKFAGNAQRFYFLFEPFEFGFFSTKDICGILHEFCLRGVARPKDFKAQLEPCKRNLSTRRLLPGSVAEMVRMSFEDGERPIHLLEHDQQGEFMGYRHFSKGELQIGLLASFVAESISRADRKY